MAHHATPAENQSALKHFIQLPVSSEMVRYLAYQASQVIHRDQPLQEAPLPSVEAFIESLVENSHVQVPTLMTSLVYLSRLKSRLAPVSKAMRCAIHRIFLSSLIVAAKNLNDNSPKNKDWARYTTVQGYPNFGFSIADVNLMERQLLFFLDWDLRINPEDLYDHLEPFLAPIREQQRLFSRGETGEPNYCLRTSNLHASMELWRFILMHRRFAQRLDQSGSIGRSYSITIDY